MSHVFSFSCRCRILEALGAGYRLAKWGLPLPDELDLANAESGFANSFGIEDPELSTWLNQCYKEALTQCEISLDEDVTYLIKMAAALGPEFLLHEWVILESEHYRCANNGQHNPCGKAARILRRVSDGIYDRAPEVKQRIENSSRGSS